MSSLEASTPPYEVKAIATTNSTSSGFLGRLKRMCTRFPVRDTRYLTSIFFLFGASFFASNGFLYVFLTTQPGLVFDPVGLPITSCIGTFLFFLGCSTAIIETLNTGRSKLDGSGVIEGETELERTQTSSKDGGLKSGTSESTVEREKPSEDLEAGTSTPVTTLKIDLIGEPSFTWVPSAKDLREFYIRDIAFIASVISWTGILFFIIATIAYIPGVTDLTNTNNYYYLALLPTFLGGFFFMVAALMQTTLTQRKWYIPAPTSLRWWVGFWNSLGSLGFALGGCLWYAGETAYWSATLASFWGAWGWVIGSFLRWYIVIGDY